MIHHYIGCKFIHPDSLMEDKTFILQPHTVDMIWNENSRLLLRPLSSMTHEEALELCKIASPTVYGYYRFSKWVVTLDPKSDANWSVFDVTNEKTAESFTVDLIDGEVRVYDDKDIQPSLLQHHYWQWYFHKGFAVPMYPSGKTLIELGMALDISTLNKTEK